MALEVLKGRISGYKRKRDEASFVFTDDDREGLGVIAIAAGLAGLSGQAISTASAAASTEEDADYLEFQIDGKPVRGWVWRSPFRLRSKPGKPSWLLRKLMQTENPFLLSLHSR